MDVFTLIYTENSNSIPGFYTDDDFSFQNKTQFIFEYLLTLGQHPVYSVTFMGVIAYTRHLLAVQKSAGGVKGDTPSDFCTARRFLAKGNALPPIATKRIGFYCS